jgi:serine/threonine protein kinase
MATVFRAHDEVLGRKVAVKLFHDNSVDPGREEGELAVLASLNHHGLVNLYDAGVDVDESGQPHRFLVMALVSGVNLQDRLLQAPITPRHIAEVGYDMAEALEYIHARNVIHRDIKPSNILLVDYGDGSARARALLTDFGIALAEDVERMTREGATTGTAAYLSPEQAAGETVAGASDVYALGLVLLECFTRTVEYPGTIVESAVARLSRDPIIPLELPDYWRSLLSVMTNREPRKRPGHRELVAALKQVVIAESGRHKDDQDPMFPDPADEAAEAERASILEALPNEVLKRSTAIAARLFAAPVSIVSIVDRDRTWLKSFYGAEVQQIVREIDLSKATIPMDEPVVIEDASADPRSRDKALVTGSPGLRFYVGVPLKRPTGQTIGTLSVVDFVPRTASASNVAILEDLAALIVAQLELHHQTMQLTGETSGLPPHPSASIEVPEAGATVAG